MDHSLFRTQRLRRTALLLAMVVGLLVLPGMQPLKGPITQTSLEGFFGWRNLPFDPDQDELAIVEDCHHAVIQYHSTHGNNDGRSVRDFDDPETRDDLEAILKRKPDFFYAQQLLGTWYRRNGDLVKGQELLSAALKNAPIVLTQRYRTGNGEPLANVAIDSMTIECNRVKNHSLNPELKLEFVDLVTDSQGEVAVPVYDTVFRLYSRSHPDGYDTEMPNLGWFGSKSRIGVLPEVTAWKKVFSPRRFHSNRRGIRITFRSERDQHQRDLFRLESLSDRTSGSMSGGRTVHGTSDLRFFRTSEAPRREQRGLHGP